MMTSWKNSRELVSALLLLYFSGVKGAITSPPQNIATKVGSQTYLNCSGDNGVPGWRYGEQGNDFTLVNLGTSCNVSSNYSSRYRSEATGSNTCNLIILNLSLQESGVYCCLDNNVTPKYAVLTVLGSVGTPTVSNGSEVVEGNQLTMTCTVEYGTANETSISSPIAPILSWTTSGINITNTVTANTSDSVTSSITVVATRDGVPSYNCTAHFLPPANKPNSASNAPSNVYIGGTNPITVYSPAKTDKIRIYSVDAHCNNATNSCTCVKGSHVNLICEVTNAYPLPTFTWVDASGNVLSNSSSFKATMSGNYTCRSSNQINLLTNTTAEKSTKVTDCFAEWTVWKLIVSVIILWIGVCLIVTIIFLVCYASLAVPFRAKMLSRFTWLDYMLPCMKTPRLQSSENPCPPEKPQKKKSKNGKETTETLDSSIESLDSSENCKTSASNEIQTIVTDTDTETEPNIRVTDEDCRASIFPPSKTHPQENKELKPKPELMAPNYTAVNKTKPEVNDQKSNAYSFTQSPNNDDRFAKATVPLPPIKVPHQRPAPNPNAPLYGEIILGSQSTSRRPVQYLAVENDAQYAPLKNT